MKWLDYIKQFLGFAKAAAPVAADIAKIAGADSATIGDIQKASAAADAAEALSKAIK